MKRTVATTQIGTHEERHRVRIEDYPSARDSQESRVRLYALLRELVDVPSLLSCGYSPPQKISFYHSGTAWIIEAEAVTPTGA